MDMTGVIGGAGGAGEAGGSSFDGVIKGWEAGDVNVCLVPEDPDKLKKWLKCNLFINQMFNDISVTDSNGNIQVKKKAVDVAMDFINSLDKIVNEFIKKL